HPPADHSGRRRQGARAGRLLRVGRAAGRPDADARGGAEPGIQARPLPHAAGEAEVGMAQFVCRMALPSGEVVERTMVADTEAALRRELEDKDMLVLDLREQNALLSAVASALSVRPRIAAREFLFFNQEFSALLRAGLPILTSLDILIDRRKNAVFKRALTDIRERVKGGEALSDAFAAQGELFPKLYAASLASGERSGELPSVLKRYITYTRSILTIRKKVVGALIYPAILVCVSIALIGLMTFYVIPSFSGLFKDLGTDLPFITQTMMNGSLFL